MQDMERAALMRRDAPALDAPALDTTVLDATVLDATVLTADFSKIPPFVRDRLVGRLARAQALARGADQPSPARSAGDPGSGA
jgi:hypothetical protein